MRTFARVDVFWERGDGYWTAHLRPGGEFVGELAVGPWSLEVGLTEEKLPAWISVFDLTSDVAKHDDLNAGWSEWENAVQVQLRDSEGQDPDVHTITVAEVNLTFFVMSLPSPAGPLLASVGYLPEDKLSN